MSPGKLKLPNLTGSDFKLLENKEKRLEMRKADDLNSLAVT
jgi:hypothetical protein